MPAEICGIRHFQILLLLKETIKDVMFHMNCRLAFQALLLSQNENRCQLQNDVIGTLKVASCCRLLINFSNSFDPDQDQQNVGPDLDPNCLTL